MKLTERRSNEKLTTWIYEDESLRSGSQAARIDLEKRRQVALPMPRRWRALNRSTSP